MPSKSNHSHAARPMARAGFLAPPNPDKSDFFRPPPAGETDDLLLASADRQQDAPQSAVGADVVDDLADLVLDDPAFLVLAPLRPVAPTADSGGHLFEEATGDTQKP